MPRSSEAGGRRLDRAEGVRCRSGGSSSPTGQSIHPPVALALSAGITRASVHKKSAGPHPKDTSPARRYLRSASMLRRKTATVNWLARARIGNRTRTTLRSVASQATASTSSAIRAGSLHEVDHTCAASHVLRVDRNVIRIGVKRRIKRLQRNIEQLHPQSPTNVLTPLDF